MKTVICLLVDWEPFCGKQQLEKIKSSSGDEAEAVLQGQRSTFSPSSCCLLISHTEGDRRKERRSRSRHK